MQATVTLRVTRGALRGTGFAYGERTTCILGRASDCSPRLPDDVDHRTISRHHCLLDINPPDIRIRDFGSRNGTYVNGVKIGQREAHQTPEEAQALAFPEHDLGDGDEIGLGGTVLRVEVTTPAAPVPSAPAPRRCVNCGHPAGGDDHARPGKVLCAPCRADLEELARHLLARAKAGDRELAAVHGYTLLRELGRGGMGAVYLARHDETGDLVALKLMLPQVAASAEAQQRFLREIEVSRTLRHPHIAAVHDIGTAYGAFYFTMEYCPGGSTDKLAARRGGTLGLDEALSLILQALEGLEHAHGRGVVHRDLSPQNILLGGAEPAPVAKICDFGLAKAFDQAGLSGLTRTGAAAGKPGFMPRQQLINFKYAQPEVDTWALAACLYWLLTGHLPRDFPAGRDPWLVVLKDQPVPLRRRNRALPKGLAEVIDHALRDDPAIGFRTAAALRQALLRAL
jgi:eukaryotic-like serine/threonine-protein kinase